MFVLALGAHDAEITQRIPPVGSVGEVTEVMVDSQVELLTEAPEHAILGCANLGWQITGAGVDTRAAEGPAAPGAAECAG